ncbi:MAG: hypothetical protein QXQ81_00830 [Candidatus Thorarchaeota archaeon]
MTVAVSGLLAALSIAIGYSASFIPRIPGWGIAYFDPVSFVWMIAFLIGGIRVGMITAAAGTLGLFLFDPFAPIGPLMKLAATAPMMIVPWVLLWSARLHHDGSNLRSIGRYALYMLFGYLTRLNIMLLLNLAIIMPLFSLDALTITTIVYVINTTQSILDATIPYLIVYPTNLFREFRMW